MRTSIAVLAAVLSVALPARAQEVVIQGPPVIRDWHTGDPIPPGYHPRAHIREGLLAGGIVLFALPYLASVFAALGGDLGRSIADNNVPSCCDALYVPVVGPFIEMGTFQTTDSSAHAVVDVFLALDGLAQVGAVVMIVYSIAVPRRVLVRNDLGGLKNIMPTPILAKSFTGLGVTAQF